MKVFSFLLAFALGAFVADAQVKQEDILAYNAAINGGDAAAQLAAARRLSKAALGDPSNPESGLLAYEAAWTMCRLGECAEAVEPARFAVSVGVSGGTPEVMSAYAAWKAKPGRSTHAALRAALASEASIPPTMISLRAFRESYLIDNQEGRFAESAGTAKLAAQHFARAEGGLPEFETEAKLAAAISEFVENPKLPAMKNLAELSAELYGQYYSAGKEGPSWMKDRYWQSEAWLYAIDGYFEARNAPSISGKQREALRDAATADLPPRPRSENYDERRTCEGELIQKPRMNYPRGALKEGLSGAVIVGFDLNDGTLENFEVLASVPYEGFREEALETVKKWKWRFTETPGPDCKTSHDNVVVPLLFSTG
jgi:TonB family protein